jgi:rare lipoprotein A
MFWAGCIEDLRMRSRMRIVFFLSSLMICFQVAPALPNQTKARLSGLASVYDRSSGEQTASGESLREDAMTAAHQTLPFGTVIAVNNKDNGRSALVRINDRGPFVRARVIDLTPRAARELGISGLANVSIEIVSAAAN